MDKLSWADIRPLGYTDKANRWYSNEDIADYFRGIRAPSRAWPHSYVRAAMTKKFKRWLDSRKGVSQ